MMVRSEEPDEINARFGISDRLAIPAPLAKPQADEFAEVAKAFMRMGDNFRELLAQIWSVLSAQFEKEMRTLAAAIGINPVPDDAKELYKSIFEAFEAANKEGKNQ